MSGLFEHGYPYTDTHELNLSWVILKVKELAEAWAQVQQDWTDEQAAFANLQSWIENYFNNLNVQTEINVKLDAMVAAGTMSELIAPYVASGLPAEVAEQIGDVVAAQIGPVVAAQISAVVADQLPAVAAAAAAQEVSAWLALHVNPDTGYVIDDTFTIQGAAADAKAVGDEFTSIKSALNDITVQSKNLYDNTKNHSPGYYSSSGAIYTDIANSEYSEQWIAIEGGETYAYTDLTSGSTMYVLTYDNTKTPIERISKAAGTRNITFGASVAYVRLCVVQGHFPQYFMFSKGSVPSEYIKYGTVLQFNLSQYKGQATDLVMSQKAVTDALDDNRKILAYTSYNLFDVNDILTGYFAGDGVTIYPDNTSFHTDGYIPVVGGSKYSWQKRTVDSYLRLYVCTYDENKTPIERIDATAITSVTLGASVAFCRLSIIQEPFPNTFMFVKGDLPEKYMPFGNVLKNDVLMSQRYIYGRMNVLWFGDSISMLRRLPHIVAQYANCEVTDCSIAGAPFVQNASDADYNDLSVLSMIDGKIDGDLSAQYDAIDSLAIRYSWTSGYKQARIDNIDNLADSDMTEINMIVILAGTNDHNASTPIDTFKAGVKSAIQKLNMAYPSAELYLICSPWRGDMTTNSIGKTLEDYVEAEKEACVELGTPCYDLYHACGINEYNVGTWLNPDELHPSEAGDDMLARKCSKWLMSN